MSSDLNDQQRLRLIEQFFEQAHIAMWACDADYKVALWNEGASEIYGRRKAYMLGRDYASEFVDEIERDDSRADCDKIIQFGERYKNFIAWDTAPAGRRRVMLTNCFRIVDPVTNESFQAEIGIEISELKIAEEHHRTLRELGVKRQTERKLELDRAKQEAVFMADRIRDEVKYLYDRYLHEIENYKRTATSRTKAVVEATAAAQETDARAVRAEVNGELDALKQAVLSAVQPEDLEPLRKILADPDEWTGRLRRLGTPL